MKTTCVIVSTYERPRALNRVLEGLSHQLVTPTQVIVADDGSGKETVGVIQYWQRAGLMVHHCWQPDEGFRKALILNRSIKLATAEVLIFLDGDCVPLPSFVRDHRDMHEESCIHAGGRVLVGQALTTDIETVGMGGISLLNLVLRYFKGEINRFAPLLCLPDGAWRKIKPLNWESVRGCNFSVSRRHMLAVDGFESAMVGWGLEDSEVALRLINSGLTVKSLRFAAPVLHLWHSEASRENFESNERHLNEVRLSARILARAGVSALSS